MDGARTRLVREAEDRLILAYRTVELGRAKRLDRLDVYLKRLRPSQRQAPRHLLASLQSMAAAGAPMTITRRKRGE